MNLLKGTALTLAGNLSLTPQVQALSQERITFLLPGDLAGRSKYMISGNFGSELFRAVHIPGVVISTNLYAVFRSSNPEDALRILKRSKEAGYINQKNFDQEWQELSQ